MITVAEQIALNIRLIECIEAEILTSEPGSIIWLFWNDWRDREYKNLAVLREQEAE